jgi:proteasome alpha subunit
MSMPFYVAPEQVMKDRADYAREDVDARSLANQYAQMLGQIFTHEMKPLEVEILVAEVSTDPDDDQLFHIQYDGTVGDESGFTVLGGEAEAINDRLGSAWQEGLGLGAALQAAVGALAGPDRTLGGDDLEAAVLSRSTDRRRAFRRLEGEELAGLLGTAG